MSQKSTEIVELAIDCVCQKAQCPGYPYGDDGLAVSKEDYDLEFLIKCISCGFNCHGPCVGFPTPEKSDSVEFFCSWCRPHHHQLHKTAQGHTYSRYTHIEEAEDIEYKPNKRKTTNRKRQASQTERNTQSKGCSASKRPRSKLLQLSPTAIDPPTVGSKTLPSKSKS
ncbi:hypothetical protein RRF57_008480 [Xylaria bambusicola]|uniref:Zinc finger PHD-type domain-containing protein n=1 Tax=Xylaria bambusicola TaxID=326684 RepID=A0AAN7ZB04_9PEZI